MKWQDVVISLGILLICIGIGLSLAKEMIRGIDGDLSGTGIQFIEPLSYILIIVGVAFAIISLISLARRR